MENFWENLAEVLSSLPDNPIALFSLIALGLGLLAAFLFRNSTDTVKISAYILAMLGMAGVVAATLFHSEKEAPEGKDETEQVSKELPEQVTAPEEVRNTIGEGSGTSTSTFGSGDLIDAIIQYEEKQ